MKARRELLFFGLVSLAVLLLVGLPYAWAALQESQDFVFSGFLHNPLDGNTYLAKMQEGLAGSWRFRLPYTAEAESNSYLFMFYLLLGHISRLSGLSLILVFHLARLLGSLAMSLGLWKFFHAALPQTGQRHLAFLLAALGSGMGWTAIPFGGFTADFWVSEAYPFLSAYANPHFPIGLALTLMLLAPPEMDATHSRARPGRDIFLAGLTSLILSIVLPFGVFLVAAVLAGVLILDALARDRTGLMLVEGVADQVSNLNLSRLNWQVIPYKPLFQQHWASRRLAGAILGGSPFLLYYLWIISRDPVLSGWNAQNLTPSPPAWDLLLALSPAIWLALLGLPHAWRKGGARGRLLVVWAVIGSVLVYLPFELQRRFMLGLYIPLAGLAAIGAWQLSTAQARRFAWLAGGLLLTLPTNLLVLLSGIQAAQAHDPALYLSREEHAALTWLGESTPTDAVILASPLSGLFIPAFSGRRVLYGHPFESVPAELRWKQVEAFYREDKSADPAEALSNVDYVLYGPRERALSAPLEQVRPAVLAGLERVYNADSVEVYRVPPGDGP